MFDSNIIFHMVRIVLKQDCDEEPGYLTYIPRLRWRLIVWVLVCSSCRYSYCHIDPPCIGSWLCFLSLRSSIVYCSWLHFVLLVMVVWLHCVLVMAISFVDTCMDPQCTFGACALLSSPSMGMPALDIFRYRIGHGFFLLPLLTHELAIICKVFRPSYISSDLTL